MSSIFTLKERIQNYENLTDFKLMPKVPLVVVLNGRNFRKTTSLIPKPFSEAFTEVMAATAIKVAHEADGTVFVFCQNDEIVLCCRNDQSIDSQAWFDGRVQRIASACSAIASLEFNRVARSNGLPLLGDALFLSSAFTVPSIMELTNTIIAKQQQGFSNAVHNACFYELLKYHNADIVKEALIDKTTSAKVEFLQDKCGVDFLQYPLTNRNGMAIYRGKSPLGAHKDHAKEKMIIDMELPIFGRNHEFLESIIKK